MNLITNIFIKKKDLEECIKILFMEIKNICKKKVFTSYIYYLSIFKKCKYLINAIT